MKTLIRNNTQSPVALPLPYTGILSAGEGVVVDEPTPEVVASLFDGQKTDLTSIYTVTQVSQGTKSGRISRKETTRKIAQALVQTEVDIAINGRKLRNIGAPTASTDATSKGYVDGEVDRLEDLVASIANWHFGERFYELGNASTGIWYATITARALSAAALDAITVVKDASSVAGELGSFAVTVDNPVGVAIQSITLFTYTRRETQPKIVLVLNNPSGPRHAHRFVRPSVIQFPPTNAQSTTPMVSVAGADGLVPSTYGVTGQLNPSAMYPKIRIVATGFFAAESNVVSDSRYNKPQSLVAQF